MYTMAPTQTLETITVVRPLKVIAFVCSVIGAVLLLLALFSSAWLQTVGWRQGLFTHCIAELAPKPIPFGVDDEPGCHKARGQTYMIISSVLCIIAFILDVASATLTGIGLNSNELIKKSKYYRISVGFMTCALVCLLVSLIAYPVFFAQELELGNRELWEFGWAYGVGWGAAIFLFGAIILLLCDQEEEEIYYKERTMIHGENDSRA